MIEITDKIREHANTILDQTEEGKDYDSVHHMIADYIIVTYSLFNDADEFRIDKNISEMGFKG